MQDKTVSFTATVTDSQDCEMRCSYLDINHLSVNCEGVAAALRTSLAGSENNRLDGYKRLAMAVFGEPENRDISGNEILSTFLDAVPKGDREPADREGMP